MINFYCLSQPSFTEWNVNISQPNVTIGNDLIYKSWGAVLAWIPKIVMKEISK
jgi:hypothetical protein